MKLTIQVKPEAAMELHKEQYDTKETKELVETVREMGVTLEPMHPGVEDENLAGYFTVPVDDNAAAQEIANRLRELDAVEAAYIKPSEAMP